MSPLFDSSDEMNRRTHFRFDHDPLTLDDRTADRLLGGELVGDDAPPHYAKVADLLHAAATASAQPGDETQSVARLVASIRSSSAVVPQRKRVFGQVITLKVSALVAGTVFSIFSVGGVAAAATGNLPDQAQNAVSSTVGHIGIDVPKAKSDADETKADANDINEPAPLSTGAHPSADACHDAQAVEDAKGCSAVAKADAPGQAEKDSATSTTAIPANETDDDRGGKPAEPTETGQSHQSSEGASHSQGAEHSSSSNANTTTSTTVVGSKDDHGSSGDHEKGSSHSSNG